jgi:hypothetical protein
MVISPAHAPPPKSESLGATLAAAGRSAPVWLLTTLGATGTAATTVILIAARPHWVLALPVALVAAVSTILIFVVTFFLAGAAPNL